MYSYTFGRKEKREIGLNLEGAHLSFSGLGIRAFSSFFQQSGNIRRHSMQLISIGRKKMKLKESYKSILVTMQLRPGDVFFLRFPMKEILTSEVVVLS